MLSHSLVGYNVCASRIHAIDRGWMRERGRKYEKPVSPLPSPASANSFPPPCALHVRERGCDVIPHDFRSFIVDSRG